MDNKILTRSIWMRLILCIYFYYKISFSFSVIELKFYHPNIHLSLFIGMKSNCRPNICYIYEFKTFKNVIAKKMSRNKIVGYTIIISYPIILANHLLLAFKWNDYILSRTTTGRNILPFPIGVRNKKIRIHLATSI